MGAYLNLRASCPRKKYKDVAAAKVLLDNAAQLGLHEAKVERARLNSLHTTRRKTHTVIWGRLILLLTISISR